MACQFGDHCAPRARCQFGGTECVFSSAENESENECGTQQLERCDGFPCVDLLEGVGHHHIMSYVSQGVANVAYFDSTFVPGSTWTCTSSTASANSLVGVWSCPGFYSGTVTISAGYGDGFTDLRSNDSVLFCKEESGVGNINLNGDQSSGFTPNLGGGNNFAEARVGLDDGSEEMVRANQRLRKGNQVLLKTLKSLTAN